MLEREKNHNALTQEKLKTYIQRADFEIQKFDINGESTMEAGVHMPDTIISCTQQFFIHCTTIQSIHRANSVLTSPIRTYNNLQSFNF